jgi:hypothetical protein
MGLKPIQKKMEWEDRLNKINETLSEVAREQKLFAKEMRLLQAAQQRLEKSQEKLEKSQEKLEKSQEKTDEQIRLTNKEIDKLKTMVDDLTDGWGKFVLGLFESSIEDCIKSLGFDVVSVDTPSKRRIKDKEYEIDLLVTAQWNGKPYALIIEVKSSINQQKIDEFIKRLKRFREFFFEYKNINLIGGVAGVRFLRGSKEYALNCGLYIFGTAKGMMRNLTPIGFKPKIW